MKIPLSEYEHIHNEIKEGKTYKEIADRYSVSAERIRQIGVQTRVSHSGHDARRRSKYNEILRNINEESKELFYHAGYDPYDILEECLILYDVKRRYFRASQTKFDVDFTDIIWHRFGPFSGEEMDYFAERSSPTAPIISVIDKTGGYVKENVHTKIKFMKSSYYVV